MISRLFSLDQQGFESSNFKAAIILLMCRKAV